MISAAAREAWAARSDSRAGMVRRARARRVAAIDEMLETLERMHLDRNRVVSRMVRCRLRRLEQEVGLPLPRRVMRARNTVRLHAALLDWQDEVLDEVVPSRRALLEVEALEEVEAAAQRIA
jgi:transposase InsO family protein